MTQKELSYMEDAIGHEKNIIAICQESIKYLQDDSLISFIENEISKHSKTQESLINMLEVKSNEW